MKRWQLYERLEPGFPEYDAGVSTRRSGLFLSYELFILSIKIVCSNVIYIKCAHFREQNVVEWERQ
jgi:hypothetical protein